MDHSCIQGCGNADATGYSVSLELRGYRVYGRRLSAYHCLLPLSAADTQVQQLYTAAVLEPVDFLRLRSLYGTSAAAERDST